MAPVIQYEGTLYRPPSEADSLILQATIGCSYNRCTFCAMYRDKRFRVRPLAELQAEIDQVARSLGPRGAAAVSKVFLADGDALVAKARFLEALLDRLSTAFPNLRRVSCYASPQSLQIRTPEELARLRVAGLTQLYLGVESGSDRVLDALDKGVDSEEMIRVAAKATAAGMKLSTMILLGAGGRAGSHEHALESARVINAIQPRFASVLVMTPVEGTPLMESAERGEVDDLTPVELAQELRTFLAATELRGTIFRSNHASNYLALKGTLPKDRDALVSVLDGVLADPDRAVFVPDFLRAL
ncbi:coproporphyrinogen III oxidase [Planctomycetes bacterium Poly30]|uniref:Coproporphyrinogen III oxidase n=1 Tax=Saltatorellus ferox TaxID=2528018 RepID=A0A518ETG1_9BACT|nr:coproporphyrinogen III oxidase [Planctomycetes bacterium Poly30]